MRRSVKFGTNSIVPKQLIPDGPAIGIDCVEKIAATSPTPDGSSPIQ